VINQRQRVRSRFIGTNHERFQSLFPGAWGGNTKLFLDKILRTGRKGECLEQKEDRE
jgi:hypothetical protein